MEKPFLPFLDVYVSLKQFPIILVNTDKVFCAKSQFNPPYHSPWLRPTRYKPVTVDQMARDTHFTKDEVKSLYRAFKQECPTAILDEETFKEVYQKIFPLGESSKYAKLVFSTIDR